MAQPAHYTQNVGWWDGNGAYAHFGFMTLERALHDGSKIGKSRYLEFFRWQHLGNQTPLPQREECRLPKTLTQSAGKKFFSKDGDNSSSNVSELLKRLPQCKKN